jgi:hypothetical protein
VQLYNDALRDKTLSAEARFIGSLFATYAGRDGLAYPNARTLMELTGWGERKVKAARAELVRSGWLEKKFARGRHGRFERNSGSGRGPAVKYRVSPKLLRPKTRGVRP